MPQYTLAIPLNLQSPQNELSEALAHIAAHMRQAGFKLNGTPQLLTGPLRFQFVVETDDDPVTPAPTESGAFGQDVRQRLMDHLGIAKVP